MDIASITANLLEVLAFITNSLGIFNSSKYRLDIWLREEYPVPKSSMDIQIPFSLRRLI